MSASIPLIGADAVAALLPMTEAIDVLDAAFAAGLPTGPDRASHDTGDAELLIMPAWGEVGTGVKLVTVNPANAERRLPRIHASYMLFDAHTSAPVAVIEGNALTALRTGALSGVATRRLAPRDARRLVIFGSGVQAYSHLEAMIAARDLAECIVVARSPTAKQLVEHARRQGLEARVGTPSDVADADVVCTCTSSVTPLFDGRDLPRSVHVNAIGSHQPSVREVDAETVASSSVWVEDTSAAAREAGDLLCAVDEGAFTLSDARELGELCRGGVAPSTLRPRTLFKGVGLAGEDLVVAAEVLRRWTVQEGITS